MKFHNRAAWQIENDSLRVTVLKGGGHIAEVLYKSSSINPLWVPPWPSIDPAEYDPNQDRYYGCNDESRLLSGIMGHTICLGTFGPPSAEQLHSGISVHGEAPIAAYDGEVRDSELHLSALLRPAQLRFTRTIRLDDGRPELQIRESVENLSSTVRHIAWTQHVTLGPPFLVPGETRFLIRANRSRVFENDGFDAGGLVRGADFAWPQAPSNIKGTSNLSVFACGARQASFTTHLLDRSASTVFFAAYSPRYSLVFGYQWNPEDFPWIGIWEENKSRADPPWNGQTIACGMEFGASPFPETHQQMIERGSLFGEPVFRTLGPRSQYCVDYSAFFQPVIGNSPLVGEFSFSRAARNG